MQLEAQYIANLKQDIQCADELVGRAKTVTENANPVDKPEWERELERREWQARYLREMLQVAEENIAQE